MHPQKNVISLEPFRNVERGNVGDAQAGVDGEKDKVLRIFAAPIPARRSWRWPKDIAGIIDPHQFFIGEWSLGKGYG